MNRTPTPAALLPMRKAPTAPAPYRPQPTPRVLQTKSALKPSSNTQASQRKLPPAPQVYRPQTVPKVLQKKPPTVVSRVPGSNQPRHKTASPLAVVPAQRPSVAPKVPLRQQTGVKVGPSTQKTVRAPQSSASRLRQSISPALPPKGGTLQRAPASPTGSRPVLFPSPHLNQTRSVNKPGFPRVAVSRVSQFTIQRSLSLRDLPRDRWWKLYIDKQHHKEAKRKASEGRAKWAKWGAVGLGLMGMATGGMGYLGGPLIGALGGFVAGGLGGYTSGSWSYDPSLYYDNDQSPGYKAAMEKAFDQEILGRGSRLETYDDYNALHDLVTRGLPRGLNTNFGPSGSDILINKGTPREAPMGSTKFHIGGKGSPARDLYEETLRGKHLVADYILNSHVQPDSICRLTPEYEFHTNYTQREGEQYVQAALDRYHQEKATAWAADAKLAAIVRLIRSLHVIHAFRDANGRLHIMLMLNKLLAEEGFSPTYLKSNPEIFGGSYSIDELVTEVKRGMQSFKRLVHKSNPDAVKRQLHEVSVV